MIFSLFGDATPSDACDFFAFLVRTLARKDFVVVLGVGGVTEVFDRGFRGLVSGGVRPEFLDFFDGAEVDDMVASGRRLGFYNLKG